VVKTQTNFRLLDIAVAIGTLAISLPLFGFSGYVLLDQLRSPGVKGGEWGLLFFIVGVVGTPIGLAGTASSIAVLMRAKGSLLWLGLSLLLWTAAFFAFQLFAFGALTVVAAIYALFRFSLDLR